MILIEELILGILVIMNRTPAIGRQSGNQRDQVLGLVSTPTDPTPGKKMFSVKQN